MSEAERRRLHASLKRLATKGVEPYWVLDNTPDLLELKGVRVRVPAGADEEQEVAALVEYLRDACSRVPKRAHRILLTIVLALDAAYLGTSAEHRYTEAGKQFRGGGSTVTWGTIRQHHLGKAADSLVDVIDADEV